MLEIGFGRVKESYCFSRFFQATPCGCGDLVADMWLRKFASTCAVTKLLVGVECSTFVGVLPSCLAGRCSPEVGPFLVWLALVCTVHLLPEGKVACWKLATSRFVHNRPVWHVSFGFLGFVTWTNVNNNQTWFLTLLSWLTSVAMFAWFDIIPQSISTF